MCAMLMSDLVLLCTPPTRVSTPLGIPSVDTYDDAHNINTEQSATHTGNTDTHTAASIISSSRHKQATRHLALIRSCTLYDTAHEKRSCDTLCTHLVHMLSRLTGLHTLLMRHTAYVQAQYTQQHMRDAVAHIRHMTQLHMLELRHAVRESHPAYKTYVPTMLNALRHLPPTLTRLKFDVDMQSWHDGRHHDMHASTLLSRARRRIHPLIP